jgi:hypothetical protein
VASRSRRRIAQRPKVKPPAVRRKSRGLCGQSYVSLETMASRDGEDSTARSTLLAHVSVDVRPIAMCLRYGRLPPINNEANPAANRAKAIHFGFMANLTLVPALQSELIANYPGSARTIQNSPARWRGQVDRIRPACLPNAPIRNASLHLRHEQPVGHALLKMPDDVRLARRD